MEEDVLIHQKSGQKVCNIEEHYGLATIEFNPVDVAVEKISFLAKEDASDLKENVPLMAKSLAKEDASEENPSIVAKEDAPTEKKMDTEQKEDVSTLKKSDTDPVLAAVAAASGGEISVDQITSASDWLKSASDNPKWMNQKEDLIQSANGPKKRRSLVSKKRCKKSRSQAVKTGFSH
jgi:hypothetical protein